MTNRWTGTRNVAAGGDFQVIARPRSGATVDVTYVRGARIQITDASDADPFGHATCQLTFPSVTVNDDLGSGELFWLKDYTDITIYWVPVSYSPGGGTPGQYIDPLTNQVVTRSGTTNDNRSVVWDGYIASLEFSQSQDGHTVTAQCQGALFQVDNYLQKPFYPARPYPFEVLIAQAFDTKSHPNLRTNPLKIEWPTGWTKKAPAIRNTIYDPVGVAPGANYTGYATRSTGSWDRKLTGFVQDLLAMMFTQDDCGVTPGNQWTIRCDYRRQPVLYVRNRLAAPKWTITSGAPGVELDLTRDLTQYGNVFYGEGTDLAGVDWRNAVVSPDGSRTDYNPLAFLNTVFPEGGKNTAFDPNQMLREIFVNFGSGFNQDQAITSARKMLQRDLDPGFSGSVTLSIDPPEGSRWLIKAGDNITLQYFAGSGSDGLVFHVASVSRNPEEGTVELKVDTKFRDLLTLEESLARTRDALTPVKLLQVNRRSLVIEDAMAPWDYNAGSGFMPRASVTFFRNIAATDQFPWVNQAKRYPPFRYPQYYVRVNSNNPSRWNRWTLGYHFPILMSEKGTIRLLQMAAFDENGNQIPVKFHFSMYFNPVTTDNLPRDANGPSPFIPNAFQSTDQNGQPFQPGAFLAPDKAIIDGWGTRDQPAGYSPGLQSNGYPCTGRLTMESTFTFDCTQNPDFQTYLAPGKREPVSAYTVYGALYAESPTGWDIPTSGPTFFLGRMFRAVPGT